MMLRVPKTPSTMRVGFEIGDGDRAFFFSFVFVFVCNAFVSISSLPSQARSDILVAQGDALRRGQFLYLRTKTTRC